MLYLLEGDGFYKSRIVYLNTGTGSIFNKEATTRWLKVENKVLRMDILSFRDSNSITTGGAKR